MKRDLRSMKGSDMPQQHAGMPTQEELARMAQSIDSNTAGNIQNIVNQYSGKSDNELLSELKRVTGEQKEAGQLDDNTMENVANRLSPMLNAQQRQRLQDVIRQLKG